MTDNGHRPRARSGRFITAEQFRELMFVDAEARFVTAPDSEAIDALIAWHMLCMDRMRDAWAPVLADYERVFR